MKFAKDTQSKGQNIKPAEVLAQALPWIKEATGKTVVIKYGGSAMTDPKLRESVMSDIVLLKIIGLNPIIVHGGGKDVSAAMERANIPVQFIDGLRVTSDEAMEIAKTVLVGKVNQDLVRDINIHGNLAVGVSGADAGSVIAVQHDPKFGRVGRITHINCRYLNDLIAADYIPVVASVALGEDNGYFNINADMVAGDIAAALGAHKVMFLTDVDGLYLDFNDKDTLISNITVEEVEHMLDAGEVSTGMIPKLKSCLAALNAGVSRAHIINGTTPHALLLELLTSTGVGTVLHATQESYQFDSHPLSTLASNLVENCESRPDRWTSVWS